MRCFDELCCTVVLFFSPFVMLHLLRCVGVVLSCSVLLLCSAVLYCKALLCCICHIVLGPFVFFVPVCLVSFVVVFRCAVFHCAVLG